MTKASTAQMSAAVRRAVLGEADDEADVTPAILRPARDGAYRHPRVTGDPRV